MAPFPNTRFNRISVITQPANDVQS